MVKEFYCTPSIREWEFLFLIVFVNTRYQRSLVIGNHIIVLWFLIHICLIAHKAEYLFYLFFQPLSLSSMNYSYHLPIFLLICRSSLCIMILWRTKIVSKSVDYLLNCYHNFGSTKFLFSNSSANYLFSFTVGIL